MRRTLGVGGFEPPVMEPKSIALPLGYTQKKKLGSLIGKTNELSTNFILSSQKQYDWGKIFKINTDSKNKANNFFAIFICLALAPPNLAIPKRTK